MGLFLDHHYFKEPTLSARNDRKMTIALSNLTYYRLPNKMAKFSVVIIKDDGPGVVMCLYLNPSKPLTINHTILLDNSYIGIFYCPYHKWHDIGAIYDRKFRFS